MVHKFHPSITGLVYAYSTLQWSILAAIYSTASYWKHTHPPTHQDANIFKHRQKLITLVCFSLSVLLPLVVSLGQLQRGFSIHHSPTFFCSARDPVYGLVASFVLPSMVSAFTVSVIILYLWSLIKARRGEGLGG